MSSTKIIWNKFAELDEKLNSVQAELNNFKQASPEVLSEAKEHSKKTSEFRNKAKIAMEEAQQSSLEAGKRDINITEMAEVIRQVHDESHALLQHNKTASDDSTKFAGIAKERSEYASSMCDNVSELEANYAATIAQMNDLNFLSTDTTYPNGFLISVPMELASASASIAVCICSAVYFALRASIFRFYDRLSIDNVSS